MVAHVQSRALCHGDAWRHTPYANPNPKPEPNHGPDPNQVMMLWTAALKAALVGGVPAAQQQGLLYQRMLFFYATTLTA